MNDIKPSDKPIAIFVIVFLLLTYLLKMKTKLSAQSRILIYWPCLFVFSCWESLRYENQLNLKIVVLYLCLTFFGSVIWNLVAEHYLKNRTSLK